MGIIRFTYLHDEHVMSEYPKFQTQVPFDKQIPRSSQLKVPPKLQPLSDYIIFSYSKCKINGRTLESSP